MGLEYIPVPNFGSFISRCRFEAINGCIRYSYQYDTLEHHTEEGWRWMLVEDFISAINDHGSSRVDPSDLLWIDLSISRWYGLGGCWIDVGLPCFIAMDRKPEYGFEIQNTACGRAGFMLKLKLVKSEDERIIISTQNQTDLSTCNYGTQVTLELTSPSMNTDLFVLTAIFLLSAQLKSCLKGAALYWCG